MGGHADPERRERRRALVVEHAQHEFCAGRKGKSQRGAARTGSDHGVAHSGADPLIDECGAERRLGVRSCCHPPIVPLMDAVAADVEPITIEIFSDVICPWCYIGKRRFEKGLEQLAPEVRNRFQIEWRPYQLDQTAPSGPGRPVVDTYAKKFGGDERAREILAHLTGIAAEDGLEFHMDQAKRANTLDAHRLLWWALTTSGSDVQSALKERMLRAYFVEGREIGVREDLASYASDVGLDADAALWFLESGEGVGEVREELAKATTLGITGVPAFVIGGQWVIPGAQDPDTFARVLTRAASQL